LLLVIEVLHLLAANTGGGAGTCGENMFGTMDRAHGDEYVFCSTRMMPGLTLLVLDGDLCAVTRVLAEECAPLFS